MTIKNAWITLAAALFIAVPLRIYQLLMLVDPETGFFTDQNVTAGIITGILVVACIMIIVMCKRDEDVPAEYRQLKSRPMIVFCVLVAGSMVVQSIVGLMQITENNGSSEMFDSSGLVASSASHPLLYSCLALLCILAACMMLLTAVGFARRVNPYRVFPFLALILPLWACLDLAVLFVRLTEAVNSAESFYDMFMVIFQLLCLFAQAQLFVGIDEKKSRKSMFAYGLASGLIAFVITIPNIVLHLSGRGGVCAISLESSIMYLFMAVYLQLFLFVVYRRRPKHYKENIYMENVG